MPRRQLLSTFPQMFMLMCGWIHDNTSGSINSEKTKGTLGKARGSAPQVLSRNAFCRGRLSASSRAVASHCAIDAGARSAARCSALADSRSLSLFDQPQPPRSLSPGPLLTSLPPPSRCS